MAMVACAVVLLAGNAQGQTCANHAGCNETAYCDSGFTCDDCNSCTTLQDAYDVSPSTFL